MLLYYIMLFVAGSIGGWVGTKYGHEVGITVTMLLVSLGFIALKLCKIHDELVKQRK